MKKGKIVKRQRNPLENLIGHRNLPNSNPLDAYLLNAKTVEVYKREGEPIYQHQALVEENKEGVAALH